VSVLCVCAAQSSDAVLADSATDAMSIHGIVNKYNDALVFDAADDRMAYTIRDPLTSGQLQCLVLVLKTLNTDVIHCGSKNVIPHSCR